MAKKTEKYASLGSRIAAIIIDHIILWVIAIIIALPIGISVASFSFAPNTIGFISFFALNFILWILYFTYFESESGQTLGKRVLNIKVVKESGKKLTVSDALIRTILRIIDGIAFYILGMIIILVSEKKQRLGDIAARTIVVRV